MSMSCFFNSFPQARKNYSISFHGTNLILADILLISASRFMSTFVLGLFMKPRSFPSLNSAYSSKHNSCVTLMKVSLNPTKLTKVETNFSETPQLDFGIIVQPALQDTQSRLVFRTENLIVNEIQNFVPKDQDLNYPQLLHVISTAEPPVSPSLKSPDMLSPTGTTEFFDSGVLFQGWYPTLRKSIWILSKIYRLVNVSPYFGFSN